MSWGPATGPTAWPGARCSERLARGTEAYLPFLEALDSLIQGTGGAAAAQVMKIVAPTWYVQLVPLATEDPALARVLKEAKGASQERRKRELGVFLDEALRRRPLVVSFLDDVHWAGPFECLIFMAYLGSKQQVTRLLLVLVHRPSDLLIEPCAPLGWSSWNLQGQGVRREISFPPEMGTTSTCYLGWWPLSGTSSWENSRPSSMPGDREGRSGSAWSISSSYRNDRGVIVQDDDGCAARSSSRAGPSKRELPESVRGMIQRKVDRLSTSDRSLLMAASVQGPEFDSAVVAQLLGQEPADVERSGWMSWRRVHYLVRLVREQVFPDGALTVHYRFVHVLYQNALYAALQPMRKVAWEPLLRLGPS